MDRFKAFLTKHISVSFIAVFFIAAMCVVLSLKANFFVDEIFTYGKANYITPASVQIEDGAGAVYIPIQDGKIYVPGQKPLKDFVVTQPANRFNYANVWKNEARAVHPPFHTALVHTVCSFFPGRFSCWFAGVINIVFAVLTLLALRALSRCYVQDERTVNIISLAFIFSGGILSAVTFLRMYVMAMFWITLLTYCFVRESRNCAAGKEFFFRVFAVTLCGALTHYYCILYAVLISVTYGIWLLSRKDYRTAVQFSSAMAASGILSYVINPAMVKHIFFGPRGREVMMNAITTSDFISRMRGFRDIINRQLFGNWGNVLTLGILLLAVIFIDKYCFGGRKKEFKALSGFICCIRQRLSNSYILLVVPTVAYFVIVAKITVFLVDRYMVPVYANIFLMGCLLVIAIFKRFSVSDIGRIGLLCVTLGIITVKSWFSVGWPYLYLDSKPYLARVAKYSGVDNICLYNNAWQTCVMFKETKAYRSIQFCDFKNRAVKQEILKRVADSNPEKLVVTLVGAEEQNHAKYLQELLNQSKSLNQYRKLGSFHYGYVTSYLLSRNKKP